MNPRSIAVLTAVMLLLAPTAADAEEITFELVYSGQPANDAWGLGFVTFEDTILPIPGPGFADAATLGLVDLELTISGATSGNGTFVLADFEIFFWSVLGGLDLSTQLVGQPVFDEWNVFAADGSGAPVAGATNTFITNEGLGDELVLVSMRPAVDKAAGKQASKDLAGETKSSLAAYKADLKAARQVLDAALKPLPDAFDPNDPGAFLDAVLLAVATAASTATGAYGNRSNEVDNAGSTILEALGQGALPDFTVGDDGRLDSFQSAMDNELAKFNKALAKSIDKLVKKMGKKLPVEAVLTARPFAVRSSSIADPGNNPLAAESGFSFGQPLLMMGYGSPNHRLIGVLAMSASAASVLNVYDGDGELLANDTPFPVLSGLVLGLRLDVPDGAQVPHGNVRVESFSDRSGWTFAIGY